MTFVSIIHFHPLPGKTALSHERIRRLGAMMARVASGARIASVAWGDGAGEVRLFGIFPDMKTCIEAGAALRADPDFLALGAESEKDPASKWEGPEVWRSVFGEPQLGFPVMLHRDYEVDRRHLKSFCALLPEAQSIQGDRPMLALIPSFSEDMARVRIVYFATSLADAGERVDRIGGLEAFQSLLARAAEFGKLTKARLLVNL